MSKEKKDNDGRFVRDVSGYRNFITRDGEPGPTGKGGFSPDKDRYHLYVSYACPWANRTLIMRKLKGLDDFISLSVVNPYIDEEEWNFKDGPGVVKDPLFNAKDMLEVYRGFDQDFSGYVSVPLLVDKKNMEIVNNESSEIIRIFNSAFDNVGAKEGDYYPEDLRKEIDEINDYIYDKVNNGVYKAGFATSQDAYDEAYNELVEALDKLENHLEDKEFLVGNMLTEADIRLFVTLIRFDPVYFGHFKCNHKQIKDYKNLSAYTKRLYNIPEFKDTVFFDHIKDHYYKSHVDINPTRIVPKGLDLSWLED